MTSLRVWKVWDEDRTEDHPLQIQAASARQAAEFYVERLERSTLTFLVAQQDQSVEVFVQDDNRVRNFVVRGEYTPMYYAEEFERQDDDGVG